MPTSGKGSCENASTKGCDADTVSAIVRIHAGGTSPGTSAVVTSTRARACSTMYVRATSSTASRLRGDLTPSARGRVLAPRTERFRGIVRGAVAAGRGRKRARASGDGSESFRARGERTLQLDRFENAGLRAGHRGAESVHLALLYVGRLTVLRGDERLDGAIALLRLRVGVAETIEHDGHGTTSRGRCTEGTHDR